MKLAIIADGHHFQSFVKNYDSLYDLKKILQRIKQEESLDVLLIARDMFDFMKTSTAYLRHYEGEGLMIKVRNILRSFGSPVYAIRGNHEKEEVLRGIEQTVENFHYVKNDWKKFDNVSIFFMDTHYEGARARDSRTRLKHPKNHRTSPNKHSRLPRHSKHNRKL